MTDFVKCDVSEGGSIGSEMTTRSLRGYSFHHVSMPNERKNRIIQSPPKRKVSAPVDLDGSQRVSFFLFIRFMKLTVSFCCKCPLSSWL